MPPDPSLPFRNKMDQPECSNPPPSPSLRPPHPTHLQIMPHRRGMRQSSSHLPVRPPTSSLRYSLRPPPAPPNPTSYTTGDTLHRHASFQHRRGFLHMFPTSKQLLSSRPTPHRPTHSFSQRPLEPYPSLTSGTVLQTTTSPCILLRRPVDAPNPLFTLRTTPPDMALSKRPDPRC